MPRSSIINAKSTKSFKGKKIERERSILVVSGALIDVFAE
jgi:hypothetical protein